MRVSRSEAKDRNLALDSVAEHGAFSRSPGARVIRVPLVARLVSDLGEGQTTGTPIGPARTAESARPGERTRLRRTPIPADRRAPEPRPHALQGAVG